MEALMRIRGKNIAFSNFVTSLSTYQFHFICRYPKTISNAIQHFKKHDLDAIFVATNAPGRSAFSRVERRMAPLSAQLSGVILPHDSYGSHLDSNGKTIDPALEQQNFAKAGAVLSELWSNLIIDGYSVTSEYIQT